MVALDRWIVGRAAELQADIIKAYDQYQFHLIYQKLHNFCVVELGGFYLDIIKDRQYTTPADSLPRRSAQTALYHVTEAMVRWIAPILSFTADEIWPLVPGDHQGPVFAAEWYALPEAGESDFSKDDWAQIADVKDAVNKVLETQRAEGVIGGALGAEVTLFADDGLRAVLQKLGDELRFVLITSTAQVRPLDEATEAELTDVKGLKVAVEKSNYDKCERCWHHRADVGSVAQHPTLCARCVDNVEGQGEERHYA